MGGGGSPLGSCDSPNTTKSDRIFIMWMDGWIGVLTFHSFNNVESFSLHLVCKVSGVDGKRFELGLSTCMAIFGLVGLKYSEKLTLSQKLVSVAWSILSISRTFCKMFWRYSYVI